MNTQEKVFLSDLLQIKNYRKRYELQKIVMKLIMHSPYAANCFASPSRASRVFKNPSAKEHKKLVRTLALLLDKKYISLRENKCHLTTKGKKLMKQVAIEEFALSLTSIQTWDGAWHMVMFQVPERHYQVRNSIRKKLLQAGFCRIHASTYISPVDCSEDFQTLVSLYDIPVHIIYTKVTALSCDGALRKFFGL